MSDWIKFHAEIMKGAKRGLPRATRFIYLELALLARKHHGVLELPVGMADEAAIVDLLAGDQREIRVALPQLMRGPEPMIVLEGETGSRRLVVSTWRKWNSVESSGASTDRVRKHREVKRSLHPVSQPNETDGNGEGNARETLPDQSRGEKRRSSTGNAAPPSQPERVPEPGGGAAAAGSAEEMRQAIGAELEASPELAFAAHEASIENLATRAIAGGKRPEWIRDALRDLATKVTAGGWSRSRIEGGLVSVVRWAKAPPEAPAGRARASPLSVQPSGVKDWGYTKKPRTDG